MIKKITIKNFQSHKHTELTLDPGVNVIIGSSDAGKSAIVRALRWLVFNRPLGSGFCSHWGGKTEVAVEFKDGKVAHRRSGYQVDEKKYKAVGVSVPEEVKHKLRLGEINFQGQVDPHFLLSASAGEVSSRLNEAANLSLIDTGTKYLKSHLAEIGRGITEVETSLSDLQTALQEYDYIDECETELADLEQKDKERRELQSRVQRITRLLEQQSSALEKRQGKKWSENANKMLLSLEDEVRDYQDEKTHVSKLTSVIREASSQRVFIEKKVSSLEKMRKEIRRIMPKICPVCGQEVPGE